MALSIGNKKYRNMQEQVGWNSERIDKILEFLDGVNLSDNVVVVNDMSQILTPEELEVVNKTVSFLVYDGSLYIKKSQDASEAKFDIVFAISGSSVISFTTKEITVTLSNGALGLTTSSYNAYSVSQIDSMLALKADNTYVDAQLTLKANLSGANFAGAITAPSIIENMSGYSANVYSELSSNITLTPIYAGAVKNGNKLTFCLFAKIQVSSVGTANIFDFNIPEAVGQKLYPITFSGSNQRLDTKKIYFAKDNSDGKDAPAWINKISNTKLRIGGDFGYLTNATEYVFRFEATFLLSDNLI